MKKVTEHSYAFLNASCIPVDRAGQKRARTAQFHSGFSSVTPFASLDRLLQSTPPDEHSLI